MIQQDLLASAAQEIDGNIKIIAFASLILDSTERKHAKPREYLRCLWECKKFDRYVAGLESFKGLTDHRQFILLTYITCTIPHYSI